MSKVTKKTLSSILILIMLLTLIITQTGCIAKTEPVSKEGYYLDTVCQITIYDMEDMTEENATTVIDNAFSLCEEYEKLLSKTKKQSDVYKINHLAETSVKVHPETLEVLEKGIHYGDISNGDFDITIGRVADMWNFNSPDADIPDSFNLRMAAPHINYQSIEIKGDNVKLKDPEGQVDLGGIAKGYICDKTAEYLEKNGVTGAIVNLGGNITVIGHKDGKKENFNIGIKKPFTENGEVIGSIKKGPGTVVTSGIYERYFEKNGNLYHHILNPQNGYPVNTDLVSVTISGGPGTSCDCDAIATICLIKGSKEGMKFIQSLDGYEAIFVDKDGKITKTKNCKDFTKIK